MDILKNNKYYYVIIDEGEYKIRDFAQLTSPYYKDKTIIVCNRHCSIDEAAEDIINREDEVEAIFIN